MTRRFDQDGNAPGNEVATQYDEALAEMRSNSADVFKAFALLTRADAAGDARATYALATWYLHGRSPIVEPDLAKAISLLQVAANAGVPDALYDMGVSYEKGESGQPDFVRAFRSYLAAALRGEEQSIYEVGRCYHYGIGVNVDREVAEIWLQRAAELEIAG